MSNPEIVHEEKFICKLLFLYENLLFLYVWDFYFFKS